MKTFEFVYLNLFGLFFMKYYSYIVCFQNVILLLLVRQMPYYVLH